MFQRKESHTLFKTKEQGQHYKSTRFITTIFLKFKDEIYYVLILMKLTNKIADMR